MLELARSGEREELNRLAGQIHSMHVTWRPDIFEIAEEMYSEERFQAAVKARELYVARVEDAIAGYVLIKIRNYDWPGVVKRRVMVIDEFCVEESFRRQGIGTQMMTEIRALARAFGCTDLQLGVYPQNDGAVTFYQKCGFMIRSIDMQMKI